MLDTALQQLRTYRDATGIKDVALAFPGRASEREREQFAKAGIEVWDIEYLGRHFRDQLIASPRSHFARSLLAFARSHAPERLLISELKGAPGGFVP
jgi:hypothetical protein